MAQILYLILKTARPRQWLKNVAVFAALVFSGFLFWPDFVLRVLFAFLLFCGMSSVVYILNDIVDAPADRKHPYKRKRPIASGDLSLPYAVYVAIFLFFVTLWFAWNLSQFFFLILVAYLLINLAYTFYLKQVPIMDVMIIAAGFILRVYGGALVVNLHMNVWFLLTVVSLSLFLAVGKRQSERTLLKGVKYDLDEHRVTLSRYTQRLLDVYTGMFANATWLSYALFAFQYKFEATSGALPTLFSLVPRTFVAQKWLMLTVPLVIYGVMRYLQLVYEKNEGESPERVLLSDKPLLTSVLVWGILVVVIIYGIQRA